jgi:ornithine cyclodeaminase
MLIAGPKPTLGRAELGQYRIKGATVAGCGAAGVLLATRNTPFVYLWDANTDEPIGLVACDWLIQFRVAISVAVAIRVLATASSKRVAFFGAGKFAAEPCRLLAKTFPELELQVLASNVANAAAFASSIDGRIIPRGDVTAAIQDADIVVTLTNAKAPFLRGEWLKPGSLLLLMGSAHEADVSALQHSDALIVDDLAYAQMQGNLAAWISRGELQPDSICNRVRASLGEVVAGVRPGRIRSDERIVAVVQGLTACDISMAKAALDQANAQQVGQSIAI